MESRSLLTRTLWTCLMLCNIRSHATDERLKNVPECKDGYEKVPNSTMCLVDSHSFIRGAVQRKQRRLILAEHNRYRSSVSPTATNMMRVYWDKELARVASKWARQCMFAHDQERFMPKYNTDAGQNVAVGYMNWKTAIKGWHDEVDIYKYGVKAKLYLGEDGWKKIGHYTQVVKDTVTLVGCGYAKCSSGFKRYFVCNYLSGQGRFEKPYTAGKTCGDCPNSCDEHGLCDCGKLFCFNGGSLNKDNCTCACVSPWHGRTCLHHPCGGKPCLHGGKLNVDTCRCDCVYPYTGDTCQTLSCEEVHDPRHCGSQWDHTMCEKRAVRDGCPVMCGLCPGPCGGKICQNNGDLDIKTCKCQCRATYTGELCEIAPCNGRRCRNGGLLKLGSCKCECPGVFYGEECEQVNCQGRDDSPHCYTKDETYCSTTTMGPANCPVLCGLCTATCDVTRCQNGGTFNAKTCECLCQPAYMGLECDTLNCSQYVESETCVTSYSAQLCGLWPALRYRCPVLCGLC